MRGDKQILHKVLEHGANFAIKSSRTGLDAVEVAKHHRLADVETTLIDHVHRSAHSLAWELNAVLL
jgi:hypothetical protein